MEEKINKVLIQRDLSTGYDGFNYHNTFDSVNDLRYYDLTGEVQRHQMRNTEHSTSTTPPAAEAFAASAELKREDAAPLSGGIDYSREKEITEDEMTDELFAAVKRGDETKAIGLTTSRNPRRSSRMSTGAMQIAAKAHDAKKMMDEGGVRGFGYGDLGVASALLAQTNGNVALAKLLYAQMKTNDLQQLDGVHGDDLAREIGAYGLSESIRQVQREEVVTAEAAAEEVSKSKFAGLWQNLFGGDSATDQSPIVVTPLSSKNAVEMDDAEAAPTTMMGKVGCSLKKGLSGIFGMFSPKGEAKPALSVAAVMAKNVMHLAPKMA